MSMTTSLRVLDLPESDRPRERLIQRGAGSLSSPELLAILLGTGQGAGKLSAVGLGQLMWTESQNVSVPQELIIIKQTS